MIISTKFNVGDIVYPLVLKKKKEIFYCGFCGGSGDVIVKGKVDTLDSKCPKCKGQGSMEVLLEEQYCVSKESLFVNRMEVNINSNKAVTPRSKTNHPSFGRIVYYCSKVLNQGNSAKYEHHLAGTVEEGETLVEALNATLPPTNESQVKHRIKYAINLGFERREE